MHIQTILEQAAWRLRAYLGAPETNPQAVGWRRDAAICPLACWLQYEMWRESGEPANLREVVAGASQILHGEQEYTLPAVLASFVTFVDTGHAGGLAISAGLAQEYLLAAEHQATRFLLPMQAASLARCQYCSSSGERCQQASVTPSVYCFLDTGSVLNARPQRATCRLFFGRLCADHLKKLVVAPDDWWPGGETEAQEADETTHAAEVPV